MNTIIPSRDLTKEAPHSPRDRLAGFVIANRTLDKCRASLAGTLGEYHYDCPLDHMLFDFKGITGEQFKSAVQSSKNDEEVGAWLLSHGKPKTPDKIKKWSIDMEASSPMKNPDKRGHFIENCSRLGLNPETSTAFDCLEEDDRRSFIKLSTNNFEDTPIVYKTKIDISESNRSELNSLMNQRLASAIDLQMQMKQAHWNVKGPNFIGLHELFDKVDEALESYVDMIAERIVQLGGIAEGTVRVSAARSRLEEYPLTIANGRDHVEAVSTALSTFGHEVRGTIDEATELDDAGTADLFTEISRGIDKWLWFVEAHAQAIK